MKIGIIIPRSQLFPLVGLQFTNGLDLAVKQSNNQQIQYIIEDGGNAADNDEILGKANKLLLQDRVDAVIAYTGPKTHESLCRLFDQYKKILILADWGASITYDLPKSDYVYHHSMNEWIASYQLGKHLAEQGCKKAMMCLSLMEVGYHLAYSFIKGFEERGGTVTGFHMAPLNIDDTFYNELEQKINDWEADTLYCGFSGDDADNFLQKAAPIVEGKNLQLAAPGLFTLPHILNKHKKVIQGVSTGSAWYPQLDTDVNNAFIEKYKKATGNEADKFAVLGYECGLVLTNAAKYNEDGYLDTTQTLQNIKENKIDSPRGTLKYNSEKNYLAGNSYLAKIDDNGTELVMDAIDTDMEEWRMANLSSHPNEGWLNPYPCT